MNTPLNTLLGAYGRTSVNAVAGLLTVLILVFALNGCAWMQAHRAQIDATLSVVGNRALLVAEQAVISAAINAVDKSKKADFLDGVASGLRQNAATIVTADDVREIVRIWSPNDGAAWQKLAGNLGTVAGQALTSAGQDRAASVVETIAMGLNDAAAKARETAPTEGSKR